MLNSLILSWGSIPKIFEEMKNLSSPNKTLKEFKKRITQQTKNYESVGYDDVFCNKFKGDIFEVFVAFIMLSNTCNPMYGLKDYKISSRSNDYGVDGYGINVNGDITVVQCKYKSNKNDIVSYTDMNNAFYDGVDKFDLDVKKLKNIFLITTGQPSYELIKQYHKRLVVIDTKTIEKEVNNNYNFWDYCLTYIQTL